MNVTAILAAYAIAIAPVAESVEKANAAPGMSPQQKELCEKGGGCIFMSRAALRAELEELYRKAKNDAKAECGSRTTLIL